MSKTVDQRVVEMKFDNKSFEQNVQTTMSTLDKLKQKLNLPGASKGLEDLQSKLNFLNFDGFTNAIDSVKAKFSALQIVGLAALTNITNSALSAGKRITSALTIDPVKMGFSEYETKINAIQTIMSNTASKGTTMDDVTKTLNELNTYADKTIYNFAEMTRNIGTFTAAGVGLEESASAIQGIANLAAASGSNSQQASTAMYQLSQALASGTVKLMDWNSVVNAGMGGQKFQEALKATAREHGVAVDDIIKKNGSFRDSLQSGWITADILNETLSKFTVEGAQKYADSMMKSGKWTQKQADALLKEAQAMEDAATKVKTFTQLWSTLQEASQSGWAQSWEIIIGNFEEAKELLTSISDVIGKVIGDSANARNKMLQDWKDLGGRQAVVDALKNTFEGIVSIIKPIKEAFREIFPRTTGKQLLTFSENLRDLTARIKISEGTAKRLKATFKGLFAVLDVIITVVSKVASGFFKVVGSLLGFAEGILFGTAAIGDFISNIRDSIKESNAFGRAVDTIVNFLQNGINKVKEFGASLKDSFKADGYDGFVGFLKGVWEFVTMIGTGITEAFSGIGNGIAKAIGENSFSDVLSTALSGGFLVGMFKLVNNLNKPLKSLADMFDGLKEGVGGITGILDDVRGCFQAYQEQLKAGTLLKIASAIGLLAASIFVISTIDPETLGKSLGAITTLFVELAGTMFALTKITPGIRNTIAMMPLLLSLSTSMLILAAALKVIGSIDGNQLKVALGGMAGGLVGLLVAVRLMPEKDVKKAAKSIRILSTSLLILSAALKVMGSMNWDEMKMALGGMAAGLAAMVLAVHLLPTDTALRSLGMIGLATSLIVLAGALKLMGSMKWKEMKVGLLTLVGSLTAVTLGLRLMPKNMITMGIGLIGVATALTILAGALKIMGSMNWEEVKIGLAALGGSLTLLSIGLLAMRKSIVGAAALLVASSAITVLAVALKVLGSMNIETILIGLGTLAASLAVIGVAGKLLMPVIPAILGLAGSFVLFGISTVAVGAGLTLIATGITMLAGAVAAGATAIVAGITVIIVGLVDLIPTIILKLSEGILAFCKVIGECAPAIAEAVLKLIAHLMMALAKYTPIIADSLFELLIGVLNVISSRMPELIEAAVKVINSFFVGVANAMKGLDGANLLKGAIAVAIMTALAYALAGISSIIGPAMLGLLGVGALIAELAIVLAAIGALSQIPGLSWLIGEGGDLLQKIGTAIGQFVGGIVGGIAQGITSSLPAIASDLSAFMTNAKPFIDGVKNIDDSMLKNIGSLVGAILLLTGADIVTSIASFFTGKNSLSEFGAQLVPFGKSMQQYGQYVAGIDSDAIAASAKAAKELAKMANVIPNEGGMVAWFAGENSVSSFASKLPALGKGLKGFSDSVSGINAENITASAKAAKALAQMADTIPNEGGMAAWFTGENSVSSFASKLPALGKGIKGFSDKVSGISPENVVAAAKAAKNLAQMADTAPKNMDGMIKFGENLVTFGGKLKSYFNKMSSVSAETIQSSSNAIKSIKTSTTNLNATSLNSAAKAIDGLVKALKNMSKISGSSVKGFNDAIKRLGETNVKTLVETFSKAGPKLKDAGSSAVKKLAEGIKSQETTVKNACKKITKAVSNCPTEIRKYQTSFYNAGSYLVTGFVNGISSNTYKAAAKSRAMARAAKNAAEQELQIKSPSRVFYKIGGFAGEGFVNALSDSASSAFGAAKNMANSAKKGLSGAISNVVDMLNDDSNSQPVIRPVLDLSDIESGAGTIGSMLDNVGVGANLSAISSGMNSRIQNGTNNDVVSAINKLRRDLSNMPSGDTYNVNGVTYDDGSNITDAVRTLVRAAKVERRV